MPISEKQGVGSSILPLATMELNKFFSNKELLKYLPEFIEVYNLRPIKNNKMGMGINHSFAVHALLKKLNISHVIESGIAQGHSTWLIENSIPDIDLISVDLDLSNRLYISKNSNTNYVEGDIEDISFEDLDTNKTIVFFDDHTNVMHRLKFLHAWGIRYAIFEDNYPPGHGDSYSIRKILSDYGQPITDMVPGYKYKNEFEKFKFLPKKLQNRLTTANTTWPYFLTHYHHVQNKLRKPNLVDKVLFRKIVKNYYEVQPIYLYKNQKWGVSGWDGKYRALEPLFAEIKDSKFSTEFEKFEKESPDRMFNYNYISFVELN